MRILALGLLGGVCTGCAFGVTLGAPERARAPVVAALPATCPDGDVPRVRPDPTCAGGVCGYSCEAGRWAPPVAR